MKYYKYTSQPKKYNLVKKYFIFFEQKFIFILSSVLVLVSLFSFSYFLLNGLGLAYNDARSHLNIGRRIVEGLKPGVAQVGSVWLPLPHFLMIPTIWDNFMWHSGFSGAIISMVSFVALGIIIYLFLKFLGANLIGQVVGVLVLATNLNILYLQSTAMTELLLLATMTAAIYELVKWSKDTNHLSLIKSAFWVMLSTLVRYEGWFLFIFSSLIIVFLAFKKSGLKVAEGSWITYATLAGFGIAFWLVWNQLIFKDMFYFIFGPYSAHSQQALLENAGNLSTKGNLWLSTKFYLYALVYTNGLFTIIAGTVGALILWLDERISSSVRIAATSLMAPLIFNILALYLGHSVLYIQGLSGNTWFNVRYGVMMIPSLAIFIGYLVSKLRYFSPILIGLLITFTILSFFSSEAVTIEDAKHGASQKNVAEVSSWLRQNATNKDGFVLISAASHDAIIFSSGLPMKKFIHEGTGKYWDSAAENPDRWARWIIMRTNDDTDLTFHTIKNSPALSHYKLVGNYPFADIYELKSEYLTDLHTKPVNNLSI